MPIDFRPWAHGRPIDLSKLKSKIVWFVDVTPPLESLWNDKELGACFAVVILDHHDNETVADTSIQSRMMENVRMELERGNRCGAMMVFEALCPNRTKFPIPPWLIAINKGDTGLIRTRTPDEIAFHAWITREDAMESATAFRHAIQEDAATALHLGRKLVTSRAEECETAWDNMKIQICFAPDGSNLDVGYVRVSSPQIIA